jgi:hypothetical protein
MAYTPLRKVDESKVTAFYPQAKRSELPTSTPLRVSHPATVIFPPSSPEK